MTADTYDDDVALRAYVLQHFPHLMTPLERRVTEYSAPIVGDSDHPKILKLHEYLEERDGHVDDADVLTAFQDPHEDRVANAVDRVLETRRDDLIENRCSQCQRLVRTPVAKQCLWCGYDWH
ncbi:hypothetical protein Pla52n_44280 [Stieleria varia]|uniref:Uncharacterized protein n=2 Tax=Stieleria varia TaxID=2528005 RepID=A0A5C6ANH3_9BACT|nr:hypothetical protein Pla52n_44280 [Stieleria varia]